MAGLKRGKNWDPERYNPKAIGFFATKSRVAKKEKKKKNGNRYWRSGILSQHEEMVRIFGSYYGYD